MSLKVHYKKVRNIRTACGRFNVTQRTSYYKRVSCENCKRTGSFKVAESFGRLKHENK